MTGSRGQGQGQNEIRDTLVLYLATQSGPPGKAVFPTQSAFGGGKADCGRYQLLLRILLRWSYEHSVAGSGDAVRDDPAVDTPPEGDGRIKQVTGIGIGRDGMDGCAEAVLALPQLPPLQNSVATEY